MKITYSRIIYILIINLFFLHTGCIFAESGRQLEDSVMELTPGKSTIVDVTNLLGKPSIIEEKDDFTVYGYRYEHKYVILITGHTEQEWLFSYFDKDGILIFYNWKRLDSTKRLLVPVL
jgi:hypothetical protein